MSISTERVTIRDIEFDVESVSSAGKPYKHASLLVSGSATGSEKKILSSALNKTPDMLAALKSSSKGDIVTMVYELKEGSKFPQIVGIHKGDVPNAGPQTVEGGFKPYAKAPYVPDSEKPGAQVGNALNVAALLLANKIVRGSLYDTAETVLRDGETLKANLLAGKYKDSGASRPKVDSVPEMAIIDSDDVDF